MFGTKYDSEIYEVVRRDEFRMYRNGCNEDIDELLNTICDLFSNKYLIYCVFNIFSILPDFLQIIIIWIIDYYKRNLYKIYWKSVKL